MRRRLAADELGSSGPHTVFLMWQAADLLGFKPANTIADDITWYYSDQYVAKGGLEKELKFDEDDVVIGKVAV